MTVTSLYAVMTPPPPPPTTCSYTAMKALAQLVHETNDLAGQRELIAESLESEVMEPLKGLARDIATERKKHMAHGNELLRQLKASMDTLERVCVCHSVCVVFVHDIQYTLVSGFLAGKN